MKLGIFMLILGLILAGVGMFLWQYSQQASYYREYSNFYSSGGLGLIVIGGGLAIGGIVRMILRRTKSPSENRPDHPVSPKRAAASFVELEPSKNNRPEVRESKPLEQKPRAETNIPQTSPLNLLKFRLAKGEITKAEYEDLKKLLEE